jgi:general nucleoside transport system ATP-binding protein
MTPAAEARGEKLSPPRATPLVELRGITKRFGSLLANDAIDLSVDAGQVLALLGENGAGKSTLTRILYGLSRADAGEIRIAGEPVTMSSPADARAAGIGMVTQEFTLVGPMTVTENLMLAGSPLGRVDRKAARERVLVASERLGVPVDPDAVVERLSVGERQRVEILKALLGDVRLLVLDEPTAVLVPADVDLLFDSIRRLTAQGMAVVFISHKLHEVVDLADRIGILRRGRLVADLPAEGLDPVAIAALMVGASAPAEVVESAAELPGGSVLATGVAEEALATAVGLDGGPAAPVMAAPAPAAGDRPAALQVTGLTLAGDSRPRVDDVSLTVRAGEIVGVAGVSGNGQTELVALLCGTTAPTAGTVCVGGADVTGLDVDARLRAGLGRLTEDRRGSVVLGMSVEQNLVLEDLDRFRTGPFLSRRRVRAHAQALIERFDIRAAPGDPIRSLSGGNMQKVLLARAIERDPTVLVASQPTRGLDVGACQYVYTQLRALRDAGGGVLLVSEDLDELIGIADRIVVISGGRLVGEVAAADATREALGVLMTGHQEHAA